MVTSTFVGSNDILCLLTVLICVATTTAEEAPANLNVTQATTQDGLVPNDTNDISFNVFSPNNEGIEIFEDNTVRDNFGDYDTTENVFTETETFMTDIMSSAEEISVLTSAVDHSTTQYSPTSQQFISDVTASPTSKVNTTLAIPSVDNGEIESLKTEARSLRIAVIVIGVVAGLGVLCIIILVVWLIIQKRKQKNSQTDSWMEMTRKQSKIQNEKFPTLTRDSSSGGLDSRPGISGVETNSNRAYAPEETPEICIETNDPNVGTTSFTPTDTFHYNDNGQYVNYNKNNEYVNESSENAEIYNNIRDGVNQTPSSSRREDVNPLPRDSSVNEEVYVNCKNGLVVNNK